MGLATCGKTFEMLLPLSHIDILLLLFHPVDLLSLSHLLQLDIIHKSTTGPNGTLVARDFSLPDPQRGRWCHRTLIRLLRIQTINQSWKRQIEIHWERWGWKPVIKLWRCCSLSPILTSSCPRFACCLDIFSTSSSSLKSVGFLETTTRKHPVTTRCCWYEIPIWNDIYLIEIPIWNDIYLKR